MARWGMVIDLKKCVDCQTCTVACKVANFTPPGVFWARVYDYEVGKYPTVTRQYLPAVCMHCRKPPCKEVCPTGATQQREDGIVFVDYDKCLGCQACVLACPYEARFFIAGGNGYFGKRLTAYEEFPYELRAPYQRFVPGTTTKCTFCMDRIDAGLQQGMQPGRDPDATPACVTSCIANARFFGDLDDPHSEVSRLIRERRAFRLHEEMGTDPSVYYLAV